MVLLTFPIPSFSKLSPVCNNVLATDVIFLLDTSSGVGRANFDKMKVFMKNIINSFDIDNQMTRVGIMTYDVDARIDIKLSDYNNQAALFERIDRLPYYSGELTRIDRALMMVSDTAFSEENGGRRDRNKVLHCIPVVNTTRCFDIHFTSITFT